MKEIRVANFRFLVVVALPIVLAGLAFASSEGENATQVLDDDELAVLAAAVQQIHLSDTPRWFMLADHTISFACESGKAAGFLLGDCSGMRTHDQTPNEVLAWVRERIPSVTRELTDDLGKCAGNAVQINRSLPLAVRQVIWGPTSTTAFPEGLGSPDFALYPSRVGFNSGRTAALVYLGVMNWTDTSKSFGEYVYLVKTEGRWTTKGRARTWQLGS